jgi:hypothetical protein
MGDVIVFPADEERPVEVYEHRQVFVGFLELKPLAEVMTDERKCAVCGWWAWEGRHTSPCRDGADCGEPGRSPCVPGDAAARAPSGPAYGG